MSTNSLLFWLHFYGFVIFERLKSMYLLKIPAHFLCMHVTDLWECIYYFRNINSTSFPMASKPTKWRQSDHDLVFDFFMNRFSTFHLSSAINRPRKYRVKLWHSSCLYCTFEYVCIAELLNHWNLDIFLIFFVMMHLASKIDSVMIFHSRPSKIPIVSFSLLSWRFSKF